MAVEGLRVKASATAFQCGPLGPGAARPSQRDSMTAFTRTSIPPHPLQAVSGHGCHSFRRADLGGEEEVRLKRGDRGFESFSLQRRVSNEPSNHRDAQR